jgi:hypothetical protein
MQDGGKTPLIIDLGSRWRYVVSFTLQPFHSQYPLDNGWMRFTATLEVIAKRNVLPLSGI